MFQFKPQRFALLAVFTLAAAFASGCTIAATTPDVSVAARPIVVAQPEVVVVEAPPRVYYGGQWLHYRSNAYYYSSGGVWHVATSVPTHVARYHRPIHVSSGPVHVVRSPAPVRRPAPYVAPRPVGRPVHVTTAPVHVQRTVSPRRTYVHR